jgi:hypothetical protein
MERNPQRFECVTECLRRARTNEEVLVRTKPWPFGREVFPAERYNKASTLIMPPRYPLGYGFELVQFNWRKAKTALERAREIHIIGYSLPDADVAFHSLVASVKSTWSAALTVDVWNPDLSSGLVPGACSASASCFTRLLQRTFKVALAELATAEAVREVCRLADQQISLNWTRSQRNGGKGNSLLESMVCARRAKPHTVFCFSSEPLFDDHGNMGFSFGGQGCRPRTRARDHRIGA